MVLTITFRTQARDAHMQPLEPAGQAISAAIAYRDAGGVDRLIVSDTGNRIRRWDGQGWPIIGTFALDYGCGARAFHRTKQGTLLVASSVCTVPRAAIHRSLDDGVTWALAQEMNAGAGAEQIWHFAEDSLGNLYAQEYGQAVQGADKNIRLWRSQNDGLTWSVVFTAPLAHRHLHLVHVDSTNRVWVTAGDDIPMRRMWYSDSQGATWTQVAESEAWIAALEADGANYWGADWYTMGIQKSALGSTVFEQVLDIADIQNRTAEVYHIFDIKRVNGIWFAMSLGQAGASRQKELLVSVDGKHWGPWMRFEGYPDNFANITGLPINGRLLAWSDASLAAVWVRMPTLAEATEASQLLRDQRINLAPALSLWTLTGGAAVVTTPVWTAPESLQLSNADGTPDTAVSPWVAVAPGQRYTLTSGFLDDFAGGLFDSNEFLKVEIANAAGSVIATYYPQAVFGSSWVVAQNTFTTPAGAAQMRIVAGMDSMPAMRYWLNGLRLRAA